MCKDANKDALNALVQSSEIDLRIHNLLTIYFSDLKDVVFTSGKQDYEFKQLLKAYLNKSLNISRNELSGYLDDNQKNQSRN